MLKEARFVELLQGISIMINRLTLIENDGPVQQSNERRQQSRRSSDHTLQDRHVSFATLEQMGKLIILLDHKACVIYKSQKIQELLQTGVLPLSLEPKFALHEKSNALYFKEYLNRIEDARQPIETSCTLILKCPPPLKALPCSCFLLPNSEESNPQAHAPLRVLVLLCNPDHQISLQWLSFQQQFGLTVTELRLCMGLYLGLSIAGFCDKNHVTANTARSHLKKIFDKTATHKQIELFQLISLYTRN